MNLSLSDKERSERADRETRAHEYLIRNTRKRIAQIEAETVRIQMLCAFVFGLMLGALITSIIMH